MQDISTAFTASEIADLRIAFQVYGVEVQTQRGGSIRVHLPDSKPDEGSIVDNLHDAKQAAVALLEDRFKRASDGRFLLCQYRDISSAWRINLWLDPDSTFYIEHAQAGLAPQSKSTLPDGPYAKSLISALAYFIRYANRVNSNSPRPIDFRRVPDSRIEL